MSSNRSFLILVICALLASCVGAVKEDPNKTDQTDISGDGASPSSDGENQEQEGSSNESNVNTTPEEKIPRFSFNGIKRIEPASDTKITVWFEPVMITLNGETYPAIPPSPDPVTGQTEVMYMYEIVKDEVSGNSSLPPLATFPDSGLNLNTNGEFAVTIDVGESASCGIFNVIARDIKDSTKLNPGVYFRACTYNYYFPNFSGVNSIDQRQGCSRDNGATLNWKIATRSEQLTADIDRLVTAKEEMFQKVLDLAEPLDYSEYAAFELVTNQEIKRITQYTPTSYLIYWDVDENKLIERLSNPSSLPNATVANITTTTFDVDGLESGVTYYFSVRAKTDIVEERNGAVIDRNFNIFPFTVPAKVEVDFSGISQVTIPTNFLGYSEAVVNFNPCVGCNIYRIWSFEDEIPSDFNIENTEDLVATIDLDQTGVVDSYRVRGLQRHKTYFFKIAALKMCDGINVQDHKAGVEGSGKTSPVLAPFNGVKSVSSSGSLTALNLEWNLPDTSNGVFDSYRLYMTLNDGDIIEIKNSDEDSTDNLGNLAPRVATRYSFQNKELTNLTVINLEAGENPQNTNKYCFALGLKEADINGDGGVGKTTSIDDLKFKCYNFHFTPPIFYGPRIGQCDADSTSFRVKFDLPDIGTFDEARIYYKEFRQEGDFGYLGDEDDFGLLESGTLVDYATVEEDTNIVLPTDVGTGRTGEKNKWRRIVLYHNPNSIPRLETPGILEESGWVINDNDPVIPILNLKSDTTYIYAVELFYDPAERDPIYIRPQLAEKCKTAKPEVVHNGWAHILSVGRKTNGLLANRWIPEKLIFQDVPALDEAGEYSDTVPDSIPYHIAENKNIDPVTGINNLSGRYEGTQGIVHLSWFDFKLSLSGDYANSMIESNEIGATKDGFYYTVERADNRDMNNPVDLGSLNVKKGIYLYHFVDQSIPKNGIKYYYRVNLKRGEIFKFSENDSEGNEEKAINAANTILEVVIPPDNMAFVHRFMINKHNCKRIDKTIFQGLQQFNKLEGKPSPFATKSPRADAYLSPPDRNYDITENYRCSYRGVGSVADENGDFFYDIGRSYIIDRFEMGLDIGATQEEIDSKEFADASINEYAKKCKYQGERVICATSQSLNDFSAKQNTLVYLTRRVLGAGTTDNGPNIYRQTGFLQEDPNAYLSTWTKITPTNQILSNAAYLPPVPMEETDAIKGVCATRNVEIEESTFQGRLPSRLELLFLSEKYEHMSTLNKLEIQQRKSLSNDSNSLGNLLHFGCNTSTYPGNNASSKSTYSLLWRDSVSPAVEDNNYPSGYKLDASTSSWAFLNTPHLLRTGSYSDNSSNQSSHLCVSKFGIQDLIGNLPELTGDSFQINNDGNIYLDLTKMGGELYVQILDLWKMSSLGLTQSEGSVSHSQTQIAQNNYYNSFYGHFYKYKNGIKYEFSGFHSIDTEQNSGGNFWNPISALTFKAPETRLNNDNFIDSLFEDILGIYSEYLFDDGINSPVLDEDNFNFSNYARSSSSYRPSSLLEKSSAQNYNPYFYETKPGMTTFSFKLPMICNRSTSCPNGSLSADASGLDKYRTSNLLFGGAGYVPAAYYNNKNNEGQAIMRSFSYHFRDLTSIEYSSQEKELSNYTTSPFFEHSSLKTRAGFRCIFPIFETPDE